MRIDEQIKGIQIFLGKLGQITLKNNNLLNNQNSTFSFLFFSYLSLTFYWKSNFSIFMVIPQISPNFYSQPYANWVYLECPYVTSEAFLKFTIHLHSSFYLSFSFSFGQNLDKSLTTWLSFIFYVIYKYMNLLFFLQLIYGFTLCFQPFTNYLLLPFFEIKIILVYIKKNR